MANANKMTKMKNTSRTLYLFVFLILTFNSCEKYHLKACFTVDKKVANIDDTLTFTNCSDYDGSPTQSEHWFFDDGTVIHRENIGPLKHTFNSKGNFEVELGIGGAENGDSQTDTITIQ
ncbi:MAG: hypothetical protein A2X08_16675 [Bacteroidetes bacterium GWA2_32_17]|nr:MAG: hypothetical protein A2X08_16675 [Bacteroidetes bacterium GWA2_32_17]